MPGITDPSEEYFKDGLWGWVTDQWKKLVGDDAGHLQVDVVESGLPSGAATSASQTTMITALQLIDDLRNALDSVATDELLTVFHSQDVDVEVKQTAAADLTPGVCGWHGSAWRKLALLWGYSDRWTEDLSGTQSNAGTYSQYSTAVPAGYVYVAKFLWCKNDTTNPGTVRLYYNDGSLDHEVMYVTSPGVGIPTYFICDVPLKEGDRVRIRLSGCGDGDTVKGGVWGYKMKIAE